ncbi:MAG: hypothetical protein SFY81_09585 [Verrucomicrobiota bacterium]|nr:hypothetical protein [Verrucomicrobiota bacterium]
MKLVHQHNLIFVGTRNGQQVVHWPGVALGYLLFLAALIVAGALGWYLLSLAIGADFIRGLAAVIAVSFGSAGAAMAAVVTGTLRRSSSELPALD